MSTYQITTKVSKTGRITLKNLPFKPGQIVDVIVIDKEQRAADRQQLASLIEEMRALNIEISDEEIAKEIADYRAGK
ncbi:MAG: hypothetical protein WCJ56_05205 [bacterium]